MNIWPLLLSIISSLSWITVMVTEAVIVREVSPGRLAELPCLSNDDNHRFMFWELVDEKNVISPGNLLDTKKYRYDVLTGKLMIRSVSTAESGFYKCVSRGIDDSSAINIYAVELIVRKDWEDEWRNDFETNLLRSLAAVMVLVVAAAIVLHIITRKRHGELKYFDIDISRENSPTLNYARGSQRTAGMLRPGSPSGDEEGNDNSVDVDFPKVFSKMHQDQAVGIS